MLNVLYGTPDTLEFEVVKANSERGMLTPAGTAAGEVILKIVTYKTQKVSLDFETDFLRFICPVPVISPVQLVSLQVLTITVTEFLTDRLPLGDSVPP